MEESDVTLPVRENIGNLEIFEKHKEIRNNTEVVCVYPITFGNLSKTHR